MTAKWKKFTIVFLIIEGIISLFVVVMGIMFQRNRGGSLFTNAQQAMFANFVLSYGCLLLLTPTVSGVLVLNTFYGFSILAGSEIILAALSITWGGFLLTKPMSVLQHGLIEIYFGTTVSRKTEAVVLSNKVLPLILGALAIVHGIWLIAHAISTIVKRQRVNPTWLDIKKRALGLPPNEAKPKPLPLLLTASRPATVPNQPSRNAAAQNELGIDDDIDPDEVGDEFSEGGAQVQWGKVNNKRGDHHEISIKSTTTATIGVAPLITPSIAREESY